MSGPGDEACQPRARVESVPKAPAVEGEVALPPLQLLATIEVAAREGSFRQAAQSLCITPSAVSQQIKALEDALGVALFVRSPGAVALTATGERYLSCVCSALTTLREGTHMLREPSAQAARHGLGVVIGLSPVVNPWLRDGCLKVALSRRWAAGAFYFACRPEERGDAALLALCDWVRARLVELSSGQHD